MLVFNAIFGQSIWDVVFNTYGNSETMSKLLQDNNVDSVNVVPQNRQPFEWDENLVENQAVNITNTNSKIIYATSPVPNGNVLSIVQGSSGQSITNNGYTPSNPNPATMIKYEESSETQYVAAGGETSVTLTELIGCTIVQIEKEIRPLLKSDYLFNTNSGTITLQNGIVLGEGETLFIIKTKLITS